MPLSGWGRVQGFSPSLPIPMGDIAVNGSARVRLRRNVPDVKAFARIELGTI